MFVDDNLRYIYWKHVRHRNSAYEIHKTKSYFFNVLYKLNVPSVKNKKKKKYQASYNVMKVASSKCNE